MLIRERKETEFNIYSLPFKNDTKKNTSLVVLIKYMTIFFILTLNTLTELESQPWLKTHAWITKASQDHFNSTSVWYILT